MVRFTDVGWDKEADKNPEQHTHVQHNIRMLTVYSGSVARGAVGC
jgi:hypothetical protein